VTSASARVALAVGLAACVAGAADPPGSPRVDEALAVCLRAPKAPAAERAGLLAHGLALAEEAVAANERDAKAHFAVFCNLGKQMELRGLDVRNLLAVRRLRREVDRTLELAPDYSDALVGKGALLLDLPRPLGGDAAEGERLLRAALRVDPDYVDAHLKLARALDARGAREEARREARSAVAAAEHDPDDREQLLEARALLARLEN
jgi:hypothetical protein